MRRLHAIPLVAALAVLVAAPRGSSDRDTDASGASVSGQVQAAAPAMPVARRTDVVTVTESRELTRSVADAAVAAAYDAGAAALVVHGATLGLVAVYRGAAPIQALPPGWRIPLTSAAVPPDAAGHIMNRRVAQVLSSGAVVMGATSASLRGAQAGDVVEILGGGGGHHHLTIGLVAPDDVVGNELVLGPATAAAIGFDRPSYVAIWGIPDRVILEEALARRGLMVPGVRIRRSWEPRSPDSTLSLARTKALLGEFAYSGSGDRITIDPAWRDQNIAFTQFGGVGLRMSCHRAVIPAIQGALDEIAASGLGGLVDTADSNSFGGCFVPREVRPLGSTTGGSLSRHTWGMAIDVNPSTNPLGGTPRLDCRIVRIFRKWGFAWGGNFPTPDGMHFEYVGERRDQWQYPSQYCPNPPSAGFGPAPASGPELLAPEDPFGDH